MATKFFLTKTASNIVTADLDQVAALAIDGTGQDTGAISTVTGPTAGVQAFSGGIQGPTSWWTKPLDPVTISNTITFNLYGNESAMAANAGAQVKVERCDFFGNILSTIINSEFGSEFGSGGLTVQNWTGAPSSTTLVLGDRLRITLWINDAGGTMATGFTTQYRYNTDVAGLGDTWVQFTETITEAIISLPVFQRPTRVWVKR